MSRLGPIGRLGRWTATHFRAVVIAWAVVAVGLGVFAPKVEHALSAPAGRPPARSRSQARELDRPQLRGPVQLAR